MLLRHLLLILMTVLLLTTPAGAHELKFTKAVVTFDADCLRYTADVQYDVDALIADTDPGHMTLEDFARIQKIDKQQLERELEILAVQFDKDVNLLFDGKKARSEVSFPEHANGVPTPPLGQTTFERNLRRVVLTGTVPPDALEFVFGVQDMGNCALTINREGSEDSVLQAMPLNTPGTPYQLRTPHEAMTTGQIVVQYFHLGFVHIMPEGIDHILFVMGLFLLASQLKPLFWQITSFTIAHSVTLVLCVFDLISIPQELVEAIVALSIAYVAVENLFTKEMHWWRPVVIFCFGLLHGLGFAGGLKEIGLPTKGDLITALFTFNVGVEVGHLSVVAIAFLLLGWARKKEWYRMRVVFPISGAIACVAIYWSIERFWGILAG